MADHLLQPFAKGTVLCKDGWLKGQGLKIAGNLEMELADTAADDCHAIAADDKLDGEYGTVFFAGIVPIRVINAAGSAGQAFILSSTGLWTEEAGGAAVGVKRQAIAFADYDLDASATTTGLVTSLFMGPINGIKGA